VKIPWTRTKNPKSHSPREGECLILIMPDFPGAEAHDGNKSILGHANYSVATDMRPWKSSIWWLVDTYIFTVLVPPHGHSSSRSYSV